MIAPSVWFTVWRKHQRGEKAPEDFSFHFFSSPRSSFAIRSLKSLHLTACCSATIVLISAMTHAWVWGVLIMSRKRVRFRILPFFPASARAERHRCDKFNPRSWCCCFLCVFFKMTIIIIPSRTSRTESHACGQSSDPSPGSAEKPDPAFSHTHTHTHTELSHSQLAPAGTYK